MGHYLAVSQDVVLLGEVWERPLSMLGQWRLLEDGEEFERECAREPKEMWNAVFWREKSGDLSSLLPFQRDFSKRPIFLSRFKLDPFGCVWVQSLASG